MTAINPHLRDAVVAEIAQIMVAIGQDSDARHAAALAQFPGCPRAIIWAAEREADRLIEGQFLGPLAERFADQIAAREEESAKAWTPALDWSPRTSPAGSSHLDLDIPF